MLLLTILACTLGFEFDDKGGVLSFEQTKSAHYFNYDKAIASSVRIVSHINGIEQGHASGNYFRIGSHKFVVTAAHVLGEKETLYVEDYKTLVQLDIVAVDAENDIAFLMPRHKLHSAKAINYRTNKKLDITGDTMVYAGYPADLNKSVFNGTVATCTPLSFMMQSFALPGASGSIVFDNKGMAVGVLSAIKVGYHGLGPFPQLHGTLVYVNRLTLYDRYKLEELLVKWKSSK